MSEIENLLNLKNIENIVDDICNFIKNQIFTKLERKGCVVGLSGGIDSTITSTLSTKALGSENVIGIIMPEKESDPESEILAVEVAKKLNIHFEIIDITNILEDYGVYEKKEKIVRMKFPQFNDKCKYSIRTNSKFQTNIGIPFLEILDDKNNIHKFKISLSEFLEITAATSIKHRVRMTILYYFAEKNNFCVIGTTNKSEFLQGYFVKYGDGGSDLEPLVNLYKTQVYQIGKFLNISNSILKKDPSPDVWSLDTNDEEFFYAIPYNIVDLILYSIENNLDDKQIAIISNLSMEKISSLKKSYSQRFHKTKHMRQIPYSWIPNGD